MGTLEVRLENGKQRKTYTNSSFTLFLNYSLLLERIFFSFLFCFRLNYGHLWVLEDKQIQALV